MASPNTHLIFALSDEFVANYPAFPESWGDFAKIIFYRTYSRVTSSGSKETFRDSARRVIEGTFSEQMYHCQSLRIPFDYEKAQRSAEEAFDLMFKQYWSPPGRGFWMMGTEYVHGDMHRPRVGENRPMGAALQNCAFVSTEESVPEAMEFLMDASMLGVGVGFDVAGAGKHKVYENRVLLDTRYVIPDTREGWVESTRLLLASYLEPGHPRVAFDYSAIRKAGEPIKRFGGTSAGPKPLIDLHEKTRELLENRYSDGGILTSRDITDIGNLIGKCVVAGNVRRSAEIVLGYGDDDDFVGLKDYTNPANAERTGPEGWSWVSNNSLIVDQHHPVNYDWIANKNATNGEPGLVFLDLIRKFGRLKDEPNNADYRASGTNPCGEQTLESFECCNLVETYPSRAPGIGEWWRTLKFAYLYSKTVTLIPTHWERTNSIMQRNRRIGASVSGVAELVDKIGWSKTREWLDTGYNIICEWDEIYSEWLCVRESIKKTSVKPSGTVSKLFGIPVSPGAHWNVFRTWIQNVRFAKDDALAQALIAAGYEWEPAYGDSEHTIVISLPVRGAPGVRSQSEVSVYEKFALAALLQREWADNQVSVTITFDPEKEPADLAAALKIYDGQLKSLSMLPIDPTAYPQMPMVPITDEEYESRMSGVQPVDYGKIYGRTSDHEEAEGELFCSTDACEIRYDQG